MKEIRMLKNFVDEMTDEWDIETDENGDLCFDYHAFWHDFNVIRELVDKIYDTLEPTKITEETP